jgi:predicted permease
MLIPTRIRSFWRNLIHCRHVDQELDEEVRSYLDELAEKNISEGMSREEAQRKARISLGGVEQVKEHVRDARAGAWLASVAQDLHYGLRQLRRSPGFAAVAILTLALGIGANTAIFSLIDAVMLSSMPVRDPSHLVLFRWRAHHSPRHLNSSSFGDCVRSNSTASYSSCVFPLPTFERMQSQTKLFSGVIAFAGPLQFDLTGNGTPTMAHGELVSGNYFSTLGVGSAVGRMIGPEDDTSRASPVVVLSYAYWQTAFGGAKSAVGRIIILNNIPFTIIGVAAPSFTRLSPGKTQNFWLPISMEPRLNSPWLGNDIQDVSTWWLVLLGRLKPGISRAQAQAAATLIFRNQMLHVAKSKPMFAVQDDPTVTLLPAQEGLTGLTDYYSKPLYLLVFAVGFILLIACANVAGLLLARGAARQKEIAVRLAVGGGRARIIRQLLTESLLLSVAGGLLGVLFAFWSVPVLTALLWGHADHPNSFIVAPDWRVLAFTISISVLTGILFGLAPALRGARVDLTPALKESALTAPASLAEAHRWFHLKDALVVAQVGLSVVLLAGAGLLVRTLVNLRDLNPGFDTQNLLLFDIDPTSVGYKDPQIRNLYQKLSARLAALPGVTSVSYSLYAVLADGQWSGGVYMEGHSGKPAVDLVSPGPGFLRTLRIPLLEGRAFNSNDFEQAAEAAAAEQAIPKTPGSSSLRQAATPQKPAAPPVPVLVNRTFVRQFFAHQNPLGKRLGNDKARPRAWEIVGVVGDVKVINLRRRIHPTVYIPDTGGSATFELRVAGEPAALIPAVRKLASQVANHLPLFSVHTQTEEIDNLLQQERFVARVSGFFSVLALLLACVGLYGLLAYEVSRRIHEIGVRMALGAQKADVLKLVLKQGFGLTLIGLALGAAGALALTRFLSSLLYGIKPTDPLTFAAVSLILIVTVLVACYIPARRAAQVDPIVALRYE